MLVRRIKLMIRRRLTPDKERAFKKYTDALVNRAVRFKGGKAASLPPRASLSAPLCEGDLVRVRSAEEIEATLNHWRQCKGLTFMPEMKEHCGTIHRVHKSMRRFVDERDLRVKSCRGIILLQDVMCKGTAEFGSCDRSCFCFWREEWLEKITD